MVQECKRIAIVGAGAAGCISAYLLLKAGCDVTIFDYSTPLRTLLPTGGGRCNLAHAEYDFKELAKNYPRGEKFLFSVFSKFSTYDTISLFEELGIRTYVQDDNRIFPVSNSAKQVREIILENIKKAQFIKECVTDIKLINSEFKLKTEKAEYLFTDVIIATGGAKTTKQICNLKHNIIEKKPSLVGLNTNIKELSGISLKGVVYKELALCGDILFTHFGISGPLTYKISAIKAYDKYPYDLVFDLYPEDFDFQKILNLNPHKDIKNVLSEFLPKKFVLYLLQVLQIQENQKACMIDGKTRDRILDKIHNFEIKVLDANKGEETVTAGGIDLQQINSKTMESKIIPRLYFIGEVLDIDGFCGGFNLQNAWSTAFVASDAIINS